MRKQLLFILALSWASLLNGQCPPTTPLPTPVLESFTTIPFASTGILSNCWIAGSGANSAFRWETENSSGVNKNSNSTGPFYDNTSFGTAGGMYIYLETSFGTTGDSAFFTSPDIDLTGLSFPELSFAYHMYGGTMGNLYVQVWDGTHWNTEAWILGQQQSAGNDPWNLLNVSLAPYSGLIKLRFMGIRGGSHTGDISLDDIRIDDGPPCSDISGLFVAQVQGKQSTIGWNGQGGTNFNIEWGSAGFTQGSGAFLASAADSVVITGLASITTYDVYIQNNCDTNGLSNWVGPIQFTTTISCLEPIAVQTTRAANSIGFNWTSGGATDFNIAYGPSSMTDPLSGVFISGIGSSASIPGLTPSTSYVFWLRDSCGIADVSDWVGPIYSNTLCGSAVAPYLQTFTGTTAGVLGSIPPLILPNCWELGAEQSGFRWKTEDATGTNENSLNTGPWFDNTTPSSNGGMYIYLETSSGINLSIPALFTSPEIIISSLTTPTLSFAYHMYGATVDSLQVDVYGNGIWNVGVWVVFGQHQTAGYDPWLIANVPLMGFGDTIRVRFAGKKGDSYTGDISLDDIGINEAPLCSDISGLFVAQIQGRQTTIGWNGQGGTNFNIEWGSAGFTQGSGAFLASAADSAVITGLAPTTTYDVYVQNSCDINGLSDWIGPIQFTTIISCPVPNVVQITPSLNSIGVNWTSGGASDFNIAYGPSWMTDPLSGVFISGLDSSASIPGLTPSTSYVFWLRDSCGVADVSEWVGPIYSNTLCGSIVAPYLQTFTGATAGAMGTIPPLILPNCWELGAEQSGFRWETEDATGTNENSVDTGPWFDNTTPSSNGGMYIYLETSSGINLSTPALFTSPEIIISSLTTPTLSFAYHMYGATVDSLRVDVYGNDNWNVGVWAVFGQHQIAGSDPWLIANIPLMGFGDTILVRFAGKKGNSFTGDISLDDIRIDDVPLCSDISGLFVAQIQRRQTTIGWNGQGGTNFNIEWGPAGFTQGAGTFLASATDSAVILGLAPTTAYDVYVQNSCDTNGLSDWVGPLQFTTTISCPAPILVQITPSLNSIGVNWTSGGATDFNVMYGPSWMTGPLSGQLISGTGSFASIPGLTPSTSYVFWLRDSCGVADVSDWVGPIYSKTLCGPVVAPYLQTFTNTTPGIVGALPPISLPNCWELGAAQSGHRWETEDAIGTNENSSGTGPWFDNTTPATSGGMYIYLETSVGSGTTSSAMFTSPEIITSALADPDLSFAYHMYGVSVNRLRVDVYGNGVWNVGVWAVFGEQLTSGSDPWLMAHVPLTGFGDTIRIRFAGKRGSGESGDIAIDDVRIENAPDCLAPSVLNAPAITTAFTAAIEWTAGTIGATDWVLEYGPSGFISGTGITVLVNSNPITLTGLSPSTTYDCYVREICPNGIDTSKAVKLHAFTTLCGIIAPYLQSFTSTFPGIIGIPPFTLPNCWELGGIVGGERWETEDALGINENSLGTGPWFDNTTPGTSGGMYIYLETSSGTSTSGPAIFASPEISISSLAVPNLSFAYHMYGATVDSLRVDVFGNGIWNIGVWAVFGQQQTAGFDPWLIANVPLTGFGETVQVRFAGKRGDSFTGDISLDDISIDEAPLCSDISGLSVSQIQGRQSTIDWNAQGGTNFNIEWGTTGFTQGIGNFLTSAVNSVVITGLTPTTAYDVFVQTSCDTNGFSEWIGPIQFTTSISCPEPIAVQTTLGAKAIALNWTTGGATDFNVAYSPSLITDPLSGTIVSGTGSSINLTGLSSSSPYVFWIRDSCGIADVSSWVGPIYASTICGVIQAPFHETFTGTSRGLIGSRPPLILSNCWELGSTIDGERWQTENASGANENSVDTGPWFDNTTPATAGGVYAFLETSTGVSASGPALFTSPEIGLSTLQTPGLSFAYHMYGATIDTLRIDIFGNGIWHAGVWMVHGQQQLLGSDPWLIATVPLASFGDTVQIRFAATRGSSFTGDISLDDISVDNMDCNLSILPQINAVNETAFRTYDVDLTLPIGGELYVLESKGIGESEWSARYPLSQTDTLASFIAPMPGTVNLVRIGIRRNKIWSYSCLDSVDVNCLRMNVGTKELVVPICVLDSSIVKATVSGGLKTKTFLWNTGQTTQFIYGQQGTQYSVVITDEAGCSDSSSIILSTYNSLFVPLNFAVSKPTAVTFNCTWDAPSLDPGVSLIGYRVRYRRYTNPRSGNWNSILLTNATNALIDFTARGLASGNYEFQVFARVNDNGSIYNSESSCFGRRFYNGTAAKFGSSNDSEEAEFDVVRIYPNPFNSYVMVESPQDCQIEVLNGLGQVLFNKRSISTSTVLEVGELPRGAYLIRVINGNSITTERLLKY